MTLTKEAQKFSQHLDNLQPVDRSRPCTRSTLVPSNSLACRRCAARDEKLQTSWHSWPHVEAWTQIQCLFGDHVQLSRKPKSDCSFHCFCARCPLLCQFDCHIIFGFCSSWQHFGLLIVFGRCMTRPELDQLALFVLGCWVKSDSASRGCGQRRCGLSQLLRAEHERHSSIDLGQEALPCAHC